MNAETTIVFSHGCVHSSKYLQSLTLWRGLVDRQLAMIAPRSGFEAEVAFERAITHRCGQILESGHVDAHSLALLTDLNQLREGADPDSALADLVSEGRRSPMVFIVMALVR